MKRIIKRNTAKSRVRVMNAFDYNNKYFEPIVTKMAHQRRLKYTPTLDFKKMVLTPKKYNIRYTGFVATKGKRVVWARTKKLALRKINR